MVKKTVEGLSRSIAAGRSPLVFLFFLLLPVGCMLVFRSVDRQGMGEGRSELLRVEQRVGAVLVDRIRQQHCLLSLYAALARWVSLSC